jgi:hypothetical protein
MARRVHSLPVFPSLCQVWRNGGPLTGVLVYDGVAEKRVSSGNGAYVTRTGPGLLIEPAVAIYLPTGTDVRGLNQQPLHDIIAWQRNPQWLYQVAFVENCAEGFANEFRLAWCLAFGFTPIPLPA